MDSADHPPPMTSTPSDELKACPLCGGQAELGIDDHERYQVLCLNRNCYLIGPARSEERNAIAAWNRRPTSSRRSVLEEAARVADALAAELVRRKGFCGVRVQIGSHLETCATIAKAIRALAEEN